MSAMHCPEKTPNDRECTAAPPAPFRRTRTRTHLLERGLLGSAAMVGSPVAEVTVEKVMLDTRGLEACKKQTSEMSQHRVRLHRVHRTW